MSSQQPAPSRRPGWRTPITLLVLLGVLCSGLYLGWRWLTADVTETVTEPTAIPTTPGPTCKSKKVTRTEQLKARQVRVSVFNAGSVTGLADQTLLDLHRRGFRSGDADNAPEDSGVQSVQVWDRKPDSPRVRLVALQFEGTVTRLRAKRDLGPGVDVIVGESFSGLADEAPTSLKVKVTKTICAKKPQRGVDS